MVLKENKECIPPSNTLKFVNQSDENSFHSQTEPEARLKWITVIYFAQ